MTGITMDGSAVAGHVLLSLQGFNGNLWAVEHRHQVSCLSERPWSAEEMLVVSEQLEKLEDCSCQQNSRCCSDKGSDL